MKRTALCLLLLVTCFTSAAWAAAEPAISLWGGIWHKTKADGSEVDCLDVGVNSYLQSFAGLSFTVSGPNGFSHTFTDADTYQDASGELERYREFSQLAPGLYTFTLDDGQGHLSRRVDTHVSAAKLPLVESTTIRRQRNPDGSYLFSWAPVNDTRTYYYRLVLALNDAAETALYYGPRSMAAQAEVPAGLMQDGATYKARVEIHDAPSFDLVTNRSYSSFISFSPQSSDYDPNRLSIGYAAVYNRFENDGSLATDLSLGVSSVTGLTSASVTGPGGFSYSFQAADQYPDFGSYELFKKFSSTLAEGSYTFHVVANGVDHYASATLTAPVSYPQPDLSTYQAELQQDGKIRFSWADVNHTGALYYRVYIKDAASDQYTVSARLNKAWVDLAPEYFNWLANQQWRVEIFDSSSITTQRNRVVGPFKALTVEPYDEQKPTLTANVAHANNYDGGALTNVWSNARTASGPATQMSLKLPGGVSRDISSVSGSIDFLEPVTPAPGLYTFSAQNGSGASARRYNYQPAPHHVAPVDFRTVNVSHDLSGFTYLSWAPVPSDLPLWYGVEFYSQTAPGQVTPLDLPVGYYLTSTSLWIPADVLPAGPIMFRIFAHDGSDPSTYNNYSRSVMLGYSGPGFDYASLSDADGDGYASNLDADDNNAALNPAPFPAVTTFQIPATASTLTVPVTAFTTSGNVAAWCLTESASSASCSWKSTVPASYTFSSVGAKTLYAFARSASGNISAALSAQSSIANPVTPDVWLGPGTLPGNYFELLAEAYQAASSGTVIKARSRTFSENLTLNRNIAVAIKGGYDASYASNAGSRSRLHGTLSIRSGKLVAEGLAVY